LISLKSKIGLVAFFWLIGLEFIPLLPEILSLQMNCFSPLKLSKENERNFFQSYRISAAIRMFKNSFYLLKFKRIL